MAVNEGECKQMKLDTFEFLFNRAYGGFSLSVPFIEELNKRIEDGRIKNNNNIVIEQNPDCDDVIEIVDGSIRTDERIIDLVKELGWKTSSGSCCKLASKTFPTKYQSFIGIHEYDGQESPYIMYDAYFIDALLRIEPNEHMTSKITALQAEIQQHKGKKAATL